MVCEFLAKAIKPPALAEKELATDGETDNTGHFYAMPTSQWIAGPCRVSRDLFCRICLRHATFNLW